MVAFAPSRPNPNRIRDLLLGGVILLLLAAHGVPALEALAQTGQDDARTPISSAFTFQGRLVANGIPADGSHDFQFKLWDDPTTGTQLGTTISANGLLVANGHFSIQLDFGDQFDGQKRWVETIADGTSLGRTELTATPYALFASDSGSADTAEFATSAGSADSADFATTAGSADSAGFATTAGSADSAGFATIAGSAAAVPWTGITGKPPGFADDVDNDLLATLTPCADGQVAKFNANDWACATDEVGGFTAGTGISVAGNEISLDVAFTDARYWSQTGNSDITSGDFIGTMTNTPLEFRVNGQTAMRMMPGSVPNLIGGSSGNLASAGVDGAVIGGGGTAITPNSVTGDSATISGGFGNQAGQQAAVAGGSFNSATGTASAILGGANNTASAANSSIGGGDSNQALGGGATISGGSANSAGSTATVGGGQQNNASGAISVIGGGRNNSASGQESVVGGGFSNAASGILATIGGGNSNVASGAGATVPGGSGNTAAGDRSFAAGLRAGAFGDGTFVWADSKNQSFGTNADDTFMARAQGGFLLVLRTNDTTGVETQFCQLNATVGSWQCFSDRNMKTNFRDVDGDDILSRLREVPIQYWSVKDIEDAPTHIGPMAQDFYAAFGMGDSDKTIATIDLDGVALAGVKALDERTLAQQQQIEALQRQLAVTTGESHPGSPGSTATWIAIAAISAAVAGAMIVPPLVRKPSRSS